MTGARAERNEYLLLHEFHEKKTIVPDKSFGAFQKVNFDEEEGDLFSNSIDEEQPVVKKGGKRKPAYAGGLVLEPKKVFYILRPRDSMINTCYFLISTVCILLSSKNTIFASLLSNVHLKRRSVKTYK